MKRLAGLLVVLALGGAAAARQGAPPTVPIAPASAAPATPSPPATPPTPDFLHAADQVLAQMSQLLSLPIKEPLTTRLRSSEEIRPYLIRAEKDDKDSARRYADETALEAFGLIPRNFPLDSFMIDVLTEQVAGLYDPKSKEFYIADWIPADEQRDVMAQIIALSKQRSGCS